MSRGELYTTALRHYLEEQRGEMITELLDEIYGQKPDGLDRDIARLQAGRCRKMTGSAAWRSLVGRNCPSLSPRNPDTGDLCSSSSRTTSTAAVSGL